MSFFELVLENTFDLLFSFKKGSIFWLLFAYYFSDYFNNIGIAVCLLIFAILSFTQFLRTLNRPLFLDWNNEIILITGGSHYSSSDKVGAHGVARRFVESVHLKHNPSKIIILDVCDATFDLPNVVWIKCDVGKRESVKMYGAPSIIVNNAGIVKAKKFVDLSEDDIQSVIDVNLMSSMWILKSLLPHMIAKNKGHIVTMASVLGLSGCGFVSDYCASKSGLIAFHESLRQELYKTKIRMTLIYPGMIETGMFTGVVMSWKCLTPHLSIDQVSSAIIKNLEDGVSADIKMPTYGNFIGAIVRTLPIELCDFLREASGVNYEMKSFQHSASSKK